MAEQSDKSDSDSLDAQETYLLKLKIPEHSVSEKIAANKLLLNDFGKYPELWDETHKHYGILTSIHLTRMLETRHNLQPGELEIKWRNIRNYYEELIKLGKLPLSDDESTSDKNYAIQYPYSKEMRFYKAIIRRKEKAAKPEKRRHSDDEPTRSKRNVYTEPSFDHLGEESSSQSVSLETGPSSQDTDSQDSSKLLSQHDTDSMGKSRLKALLENRDRGTQTPPTSENTNSSILKSIISLRRQLDQRILKQFDRKLLKIVNDYASRPSTSEDSSAAQ